MHNNAFSLLLSLLIAFSFGSIIWLLVLQKNQDQRLAEKHLELIENYDDLLLYRFDYLSEFMKSKVKRKQWFRPLSKVNSMLEKITEPALQSLNKAIELEGQRHQTPQHRSSALLNTFNLSETEAAIVLLIKTAETLRPIGVKPEETARLKAMLDSEFKAISATINAKHIDPIAYRTQLQLKRNSLLKIRYEIGRYLFGKIGDSHTSFGRFVIGSYPESYLATVGADFSAEIFLTDAPVLNNATTICATVNGITHEIKDGMIRFTDEPKVKGIHEYTVDFEIDNKFSGRTENFRKTFRYSVN